MGGRPERWRTRGVARADSQGPGGRAAGDARPGTCCTPTRGGLTRRSPRPCTPTVRPWSARGGASSRKAWRLLSRSALAPALSPCWTMGRGHAAGPGLRQSTPGTHRLVHAVAGRRVGPAPEIEPTTLMSRSDASSKNETGAWLRQRWCVPEVRPAFVAAMEDVLDLYAERRRQRVHHPRAAGRLAPRRGDRAPHRTRLRPADALAGGRGLPRRRGDPHRVGQPQHARDQLVVRGLPST
jgi:hypothetical protein